jgi:uncharacterized protein YcfL
MRKKKNSYAFRPLAILLCLLLLATFSCAPTTTSNVAVGEIVEGEEGEVLQKDYIIKDRALSKEISVLDVKARYQGDFLEGQAIIKNRKKYTVRFEYKYEWYDAEGFPLPSNISLWKPELLYGMETKWIVGICPKPHATGFKVMIREPNPVED